MSHLLACYAAAALAVRRCLLRLTRPLAATAAQTARAAHSMTRAIGVMNPRPETWPKAT